MREWFQVFPNAAVFPNTERKRAVFTSEEHRAALPKMSLRVECVKM